MSRVMKDTKIIYWGRVLVTCFYSGGLESRISVCLSVCSEIHFSEAGILDGVGGVGY